MIVMDSEQRSCGFSLTEVVVALGVAAAALLVVLALLPGVLREQADARHAHVALSLPTAINTELRRVYGENLVTLANGAADFTADSSALRLVASVDGTDLRVPTADDRRSQFFLIELHRFPANSPLAVDGSASFVALQARISWPFRPLGGEGEESPVESRKRVTLNIPVNR